MKFIKKEIPKIKREWKNILFNTLFAALTLLAVVIFHKSIILTLCLVLVITLIGMLKWKSKLTLMLFIFGGILGAFSEVLTIKFGAWSYSITDFINIPIWLFAVWGNSAAFIYQTSREIKKLALAKQ